MNTQKKVSVVMAALNEEPRIGKVLKVVCGHPLIYEVIVINDGSEDNTRAVAEGYNAKVINHKERQGKTISVRQGIKEAQGDIIFMVDADLGGLNEEYVTNLINPVLNDKVDFTLSMRGNSLGFFKLFGIDFVSGERAIKKELLDDEFIWAKQKIAFGLEVRMNAAFLKKKAKFVVVKCQDLKNSMKFKKEGLIKGTIGEISMLIQIFRALPFYLVIGQFISMARLNKKYQKLIKSSDA